jgi:molecular chaperone GrpE
MTQKKTKKNSIANLKQRLEELEANWKRAVADYRNLEKRISHQQAEFIKFANSSLIDKLLTVLDDLERAKQHLKNKGLSLAVDQFHRVLETEGVQPIKTQHQPFDPQTMDCAELVPGPKNTVVKVIQKGYTLNDRVLRPAKVEVGSGQKNK